MKRIYCRETRRRLEEIVGRYLERLGKGKVLEERGMYCRETRRGEGIVERQGEGKVL